MTPRLPDAATREIARHIYGADPEGYDRGRPDHPERVLDLLRTRCDLGLGTTVLEIGPGTGRVTARLVAAGARVTAVEPDAALAAHLGQAVGSASVSVIAGTFESADLPEPGFDLVVAAMAWHWVDQSVGLPKLARVMRPGGWAALWWMMFADPTRPDPFREATEHLVPRPPSRPDDARPPFELDADGWRIALMEQAELTDFLAERSAWSATLDAAAIRALYASTIAIRRLPESERVRVLDELERIARDDFGGRVDRLMVTGFYAARRASDDSTT
jgi:SAM-dependent methyltransferase